MNRFLSKIPKEQVKNLFWPLTMIVSILSISFARASNLGGTDIFWSARNGGDILNSGTVQVFISDVWNVTALGEQWSPNSWLWNVVLYGSYTSFGTAGFVILTFVANVAIFSLIWVFMKQHQIPAVWQFLIMVGSWIVILPYTNGRSNTVDFLILALFLVLVKVLYRSTRPLAIWWLAGVSFTLSVLWINFHLTGILAVALFPVIVYAITKRYLLSAVVFVTALLALPLSPFGIGPLVKVSTVQNASKDFFYEWSNVFAGGQVNYAAALSLLVASVLLIIILKQKQYLYAFAVVVLMYLAYDMIRISPYLWLVVLAGVSMITFKVFTGFIWPTAVGIITVMVLIVGGFTSSPTITNVNNALPVNPGTFQDIPLDATVMSTSDASNELILFRPDVLVALDGRNDLLGKKRYTQSTNMFYEKEPAVLEDWLSENHINTVFVPDRHNSQYRTIIENMDDLGWKETVRHDAVTFIK
jgi:hypothetical protein